MFHQSSLESYLQTWKDCLKESYANAKDSQDKRVSMLNECNSTDQPEGLV